MQVRAIEGRVAREDAVIVSGKTLRLHQRVLPAGGTSGKIGLLRIEVIEGFDDLFAPQRHQVDRPIAEILDPLGMSEKTR